MHREIQIKQFPIVTTHWWPKTRNERFVWENEQYLYRFLPLVHNHVQVIWVHTHIRCVTCVCACSGSRLTEGVSEAWCWRNFVEKVASAPLCQHNFLVGRCALSVARLGGFEFDCAGKYWLGRVDKIWAGFWSVWRFSKHINCIG